MKYLHTMVRVTDIDASLAFYCQALGLTELKRYDSEEGRFTLVFAAEGDESAQVELTYNWDPESYDSGRNFGHLAYQVDNIYDACQRLLDHGVTINRPPSRWTHGLRSISLMVFQSRFCKTVQRCCPQRRGQICRILASGSRKTGITTT